MNKKYILQVAISLTVYTARAAAFSIFVAPVIIMFWGSFLAHMLYQDGGIVDFARMMEALFSAIAEQGNIGQLSVPWIAVTLLCTTAYVLSKPWQPPTRTPEVTP